MAAGGDELLGAVQHVVITVAPGTGAQVAGIGAGLGLGEGEGADHPSFRQWPQELVFLRVGAVLQDRHAGDRVVHAHDGRAGAVAGRDLFERHGVRQVAAGVAVPFLRHQHAEKAQLGHFADGIGRIVVFAVPALRIRRQAFLRKTARHVLDAELFFGQKHVDVSWSGSAGLARVSAVHVLLRGPAARDAGAARLRGYTGGGRPSVRRSADAA